ncbi:NAD(P)H-dependent flavin oxidoreductase [Microbaculum sp. FT89]|uniref:NAD(P)H-dependent flavin oxidoreductase n=1 Tax=Microbaculum sp. FT89 TaxID=3447298 RepID=UPI003F53BDD0
MPLPKSFEGRLAVPAIAAPMFLVSGPDLVVESCRAGIVGTFPALNQRTSEGYADWLREIEERLATADCGDRPGPAPHGVNLIVHRSNKRVEADLKITVEHKVPLVITSLGAVRDVVDAVHAYGGLVFHDVINLRHAEKAVEAGVDGIIAVCAGAGGHAGTMSPFALVPEIKRMFDGTVVLSGALSTGAHVVAARLIGADMGYFGTRFIATKESMAPVVYKQMLLDARASDIVYTPSISGVNANFLRPSIEAAGLDPDNLPPPGEIEVGQHEFRAWKNIWSAGQGVGLIHDIPSAADLCAQLASDYHEAMGRSG